MIVSYCDFVSEVELLQQAGEQLPSENEVVVVPGDPEGSFRFVMHREWRIAEDERDNEVVVYLGEPKGVG